MVSPNRHVRTRLYFTSESHVHSLYSILKYNGVAKVSAWVGVLLLKLFIITKLSPDTDLLIQLNKPC